MPNSDKNIVITPSVGSSVDNPKITFVGANTTVGPQTITLSVYPSSNGTISFEGSAGQLFSITNDLSGSLFSVNDISGIPSIEVLDTGEVKLAQYDGNVLIGTGVDNGSKLQLVGNAVITGNLFTSGTLSIGGVLNTNSISAATTALATNLNADLLDGQHGSYYNDAANLTGIIPDARLSGAYSNFTTLSFVPSNGQGLRFWNNSKYMITMSDHSDATHGGRLDSTSDYNLYYKMEDGVNRGHVFKGTSGIVAQITGSGQLYLAPSSPMPPFVLNTNSTDVVTYLNADRLDSQEGSFYQNASNLNSGTVPDARIQGSYTGLVNLTGTGTFKSAILEATNDIRVGGISGDLFARMRFMDSISVAYGFSTQHNTALVITNEQGTTNQAIFLGDINEGTSGSTLFGVSIGTGANNPSTGVSSEVWTPRLILDGAGNLTVNGVVTGSSFSGSVAWSSITSKPTTISGYGITDAVTTTGNQTISGIKTFSNDVQVSSNLIVNGTVTGSSFSGSVAWSSITSKPTTVSGYGITDANPAFTGDVTKALNGTALTLATVNSNIGAFGSATVSPIVTVNAKGLVTAVTTATITPAWSSITSKPTTLSGYGITDGNPAFTGDVTKTLNGTVLTLATVNSNIGAFGSATVAPVVTVNAKGLVTGVTTATITPAWSSVTSKPTTVTGYGITDAVTTSGDQTIGGNKTFSNDVAVNGSLTVHGSVFSVNTVNLDIADAIITVAKNNTGATPFAGLKVERGSAGNDAYAIWREDLDCWYFGTATDDDQNGPVRATIYASQLNTSATTGTPPLVVLSTTLVSNLNADLLDSQQGSFYQNATNLNAGTVPDARISGSYTGLTNLTGTGTFKATTLEATSDVRFGNIGTDSFGRAIFINSTAGQPYGFSTQHDSALVLINEQGTTNQAIFLGDMSDNSTNGTLFGISIGTSGKNPTDGLAGETWVPRLRLDGVGNLTVNGVVTGSSFSGSVAWASITSKPTTLSGYSIAASNVLTELLTVDGAGSGLDADLLDGQQGSFYQNATNINAGTLAATRGGTGLSSFTTNRYFKAGSTSTIVQVEPDDVRVDINATRTTESSTAPSNPITGDVWINSSNGTKYTWVDDYWVEFGSSAGGGGTVPVYVSDTQPDNGGPFIWFQTDADGGVQMWINEI